MKKCLFFLFVSLVIFSQIKTTAQTPWYVGGNTLAANGTLGTNSNHSLIFETVNAPRGILTNTGLWHLGATTTPAAKVQITHNSVAGTSPHLTLYESGNDYARFYFKNTNTTNYFGIAGIPATSPAAAKLNFLYSPATGDIMTITGNGFVGIGTTSPTQKLHVVGNQILAGNLSFTSSLQSIQFANPGASSNPMMYLFSSGTSNTPRMILGHSTAYPTWGLQYTDASDQFDFVGGGASKLAINLASGNVGIGTTNPTYRLSVNGTIRAKEVRVETGWADYVFDKDYKLLSLKAVAKFIEQNKRLPNIPSAEEIQKDGLEVAKMQTKMMEKIEELTLYIIDLQKQIDQLKKGQK
jgi:hypothetical protein